VASDGNDAIWLELLVNAFESEENCIGYVQNPGTLVPWTRSATGFLTVTS